MSNSLLVRDATPDDLHRINEIYNWTIVDNHVSFDTEPWDLARRTAWWESRSDMLDVLVAESDGMVVGVSYSSFYRPKEAYRSTAETTIVLDTKYLGRGFGTKLLAAMLRRLRESQFHRAVAIIALPNDGSVALHQKMGFRIVGTISEVGYKLGRYWDTMIMETELD